MRATTPGMATGRGGWHRICTIVTVLLVVGGCFEDASSEYQPLSATKLLSSCQPLCWSSDEHRKERPLLWAARSSINQYWECISEGGKWYAQLRSCTLAGTWFNFDGQSCSFPAAANSADPGVVCERKLSTVGSSPFADGNELCPEPSCVSQPHIETLWGYPDPAFFLQCRPVPDGSWRLEQMPCAPGTWFHFRQQVCVFPLMWAACDGSEDSPGEDNGPTTPELTTPILTTPEITTPEVTTPEVTTAEITTPEVTTPDITTPEITTPEITTAEITTPEITTAQQTTDIVQEDPLDPCSGPRCQTFEEINTLWVHQFPSHFYQCRPFMGGWSPQEMPCAPGTLFSFSHQVCVHSFDWVNPCDPFDGSTVEPPVTTAPTPDPGTTVATPDPGTTAETPAPVTTAGPTPIVDCLTPNCILLQDEVIRLPSRTGPQFFYRCMFVLQSVWLPFEDSCPSGQYFNFPDQGCVDPSQWLDICPADPNFTTTQMTTVEPTPTNEPPAIPLPVICGSPRCITPEERSVLWPSTVADMFYRCVWVERLFQFVPFPERCDNFFLFDFQQQQCVFPLDWIDICPMYPTLPPPPCPDCCPTCPPPTDVPEDPILPLPIICGAPRCVSEIERNFKWPALNPTDYYECVDNGDGWVQATLQQCTGGLLFQTLEQTCVPPAEYDADFCPVFPPPPQPTPPQEPEPDMCIENFDPSPILPIICDIARCSSEAERATLWPMNNPTWYLVCRPQEGTTDDIYVPIMGECPVGENFDFFAQCCHSGTQGSIQVCPLYPPITTELPPPSQPTCLTGLFDPSPIIPVGCDEPRCNSDAERTTIWPSSDLQVFYLCLELLPGLFEPVVQTCSAGTTFDFLLQCCSTENPIEENVCGLFMEPLPAPSTIPLPIVCDNPRCDTEQERSFFWPATDRKLLYLCEPQPGGLAYAPRMYTCPEGQAFHVWRQDCVPEHDCRVNVCPHYTGAWVAGSNTTTAMNGLGEAGPILTPPNIG